MTTPPLSPAAQAVLDAYEDAPIIGGPHGGDALGIAAAIRALVEQVAGIAPAGGRAWSEGQAASYAAISAAVRHMQSIAAELDGGAGAPA
ncbi:MAG: hypothetical protein RL519_1121, partial [Pseudomonadota bacterium]